MLKALGRAYEEMSPRVPRSCCNYNNTRAAALMHVRWTPGRLEGDQSPDNPWHIPLILLPRLLLDF